MLVGDGSVTSMQFTALNTNPITKDIGFAASQAAVDDGGTFKIKAQSPPTSVGPPVRRCGVQSLDGERPCR
jgi:hypothetical protein